MKRKTLGYGFTAFAWIALMLQFLVPHHHHQQAIFLFSASCPTADHTVPPHGTDNCHHPHAEDIPCNTLDHSLAVTIKQGGQQGHTDINLLPVLPTGFAFRFTAPECTEKTDPVWERCFSCPSARIKAHGLRGPPTAT